MDTICGYTVDEYKKMLKDFHGHLAPGLLIGGFMIDYALRNRRDDEFYDVICETAVCLPDAIQMLTPCTYGNGWMKVVDIGRFALTIFNKYTGEGVRVSISDEKLKKYSEVYNWFMKLKKKSEQDSDLLMSQIVEAGSDVLDLRYVTVDESLIGKEKGVKVALCEGCGESYPAASTGSSFCLACEGAPLYAKSQK